MTLFRQEAIDHQRRRLWGDVVLTQRLPYWAISLLVVGIVVSLGAFAASQSYARKESVQGFLLPDTGLTRFTAEQGGRVARLSVAVGSQVDKGQMIGLLKQDRSLESGGTVSDAMLQSISAEIDNLATLITVRRTRADGERSLLETRLASQQNELAAMRQEYAVLEQRVVLARDGVAAIEALEAKGNAPRNLLNQRREQMMSLRQTKYGLARQMIVSQQNVAYSRSELDGFDLRLQEALLELGSRKAALEQQLITMQAQHSIPLVAPSSGIVESLHVSAGSTVKAGQALVDFRPAQSVLEARLLVPSRAIGLIKRDMPVSLQYEAFPYQRFGIFSGQVLDVSKSIVSPGELPIPIEMRESFYVITAQLNAQHVTVKGEPIALKSGMLLNADITLEKRSLLGRKLINGIHRSARV